MFYFAYKHIALSAYAYMRIQYIMATYVRMRICAISHIPNFRPRQKPHAIFAVCMRFLCTNFYLNLYICNQTPSRL